MHVSACIERQFAQDNRAHRRSGPLRAIVFAAQHGDMLRAAARTRTIALTAGSAPLIAASGFSSFALMAGLDHAAALDAFILLCAGCVPVGMIDPARGLCRSSLDAARLIIE